MVVAKVISDSNDEVFYEITERSGSVRFRCSCPHNTYRGKTCKHIKKYKDAKNRRILGIVVPGVFFTDDAPRFVRR